MSIASEKDRQGMQRVGRLIDRNDARSAPRVFYGIPGAICISLNDEAVHGIPGSRRIEPGDLVKLDLTVEKDGYIADADGKPAVHYEHTILVTRDRPVLLTAA